LNRRQVKAADEGISLHLRACTREMARSGRICGRCEDREIVAARALRKMQGGRIDNPPRSPRGTLTRAGEGGGVFDLGQAPNYHFGVIRRDGKRQQSFFRCGDRRKELEGE